MTKRPQGLKRKLPVLEALEPRVLYSADAFGAVLGDVAVGQDGLERAVEEARGHATAVQAAPALREFATPRYQAAPQHD